MPAGGGASTAPPGGAGSASTSAPTSSSTGPRGAVVATRIACATTRARCSRPVTRQAHLVTGAAMAAWSRPDCSPLLSTVAAAGGEPTTYRTAVRSVDTFAIEVNTFVNPGPGQTAATPRPPLVQRVPFGGEAGGGLVAGVDELDAELGARLEDGVDLDAVDGEHRGHADVADGPHDLRSSADITRQRSPGDSTPSHPSAQLRRCRRRDRDLLRFGGLLVRVRGKNWAVITSGRRDAMSEEVPRSDASIPLVRRAVSERAASIFAEATVQ